MASIPPTTTQSTTQAPATGGTNPTSTDSFPEQRHAGKVGYGPNYHSGPGLEEKMEGLKEEIKGKLTGNPERVQHGREIYTGQEKQKKLTGEDEPNPFANAKDDDASKIGGPKKSTDSNKHADTKGATHQLPSAPTQGSNPQSTTITTHGSTDEDLAAESYARSNAKATPGGMAVNQGHSPDAREQAATVAPESTRAADVQKTGGATDNVKPIDSAPIVN